MSHRKLNDSYKPIVIGALVVCIIAGLISLFINYEYFDDILDIVVFPLIILWGCQLIYAYLFNGEMFATAVTDPDSDGFSNRGLYFLLGFALIALAFFGMWSWGDR